MTRHTTTVKKRKSNKVNIILLCAGATKSQGTKSLWTYKSKPLIVHQLDILQQLNHRITVVVGYESAKLIPLLRKYGVYIVENENYEVNGQLASLRLALLSTVEDNVFIVAGDMLFNHHCFTNGKSHIVVDDKDRMESNKVGVRINDDTVAHFGYCWPLKFANITYLTGRELELMRVFVDNNKKLLLFEGLEWIVEHGSLQATQPNKSQFKEINTQKDLI